MRFAQFKKAEQLNRSRSFGQTKAISFFVFDFPLLFFFLEIFDVNNHTLPNQDVDVSMSKQSLGFDIAFNHADSLQKFPPSDIKCTQLLWCHKTQPMANS